MYLEKNMRGPIHSRGAIEVICGSMFSGKTEELIRRMKRAVFAKQKVIIFKPAMDTRYSVQDVVSHDHNSIPSQPVAKAREMLNFTENIDVVGIDEAQFFDDEIVEIVQHFADNGIRVIVAGLDMDYMGKPFGAMPHLMAIAEDVYKIHAICVRCGNLAYVSHRLIASDEQVLLGEKESYEPLCRHCFNEAKQEKK